MGSEVLFNGGQTIEDRRIFLIFRLKRNRLSGLFFPLFYQLRIAADLDTAPVILKIHSPAESLLVKGAQGRLEGVIIGRPENLTRKCTPGNRREIAFNGLFLNDLGLVKVILFFIERISF